jgi:hypothetical protein
MPNNYTYPLKACDLSIQTPTTLKTILWILDTYSIADPLSDEKLSLGIIERMASVMGFRSSEKFLALSSLMDLYHTIRTRHLSIRDAAGVVLTRIGESARSISRRELPVRKLDLLSLRERFSNAIVATEIDLSIRFNEEHMIILISYFDAEKNSPIPVVVYSGPVVSKEGMKRCALSFDC